MRATQNYNSIEKFSLNNAPQNNCPKCNCTHQNDFEPVEIRAQMHESKESDHLQSDCINKIIIENQKIILLWKEEVKRKDEMLAQRDAVFTQQQIKFDAMEKILKNKVNEYKNKLHKVMQENKSLKEIILPAKNNIKSQKLISGQPLLASELHDAESKILAEELSKNKDLIRKQNEEFQQMISTLQHQLKHNHIESQDNIKLAKANQQLQEDKNKLSQMLIKLSHEYDMAVEQVQDQEEQIIKIKKENLDLKKIIQKAEYDSFYQQNYYGLNRNKNMELKSKSNKILHNSYQDPLARHTKDSSYSQ